MKELRNKIKAQSLNKSRIIIVLNISLFLFIYVLSQSCGPIIKSLGPLSSLSIESSRDKGAFLCEYYPFTITIYDTIDLEIKEIFAEKQHRYKNYNDLSYIVSDDKCQVNIILKNKLKNQGYNDIWIFEKFYYKPQYRFNRRLDEASPPDTLLLRVLKKDINENGSTGVDNRKVIGSFVLRRKYND